MTFPAKLQHVAIYLRKSRADMEAEARGEGETLSKHKRALLQLAKKYSYGIDDVYEEIVSGERILERPQMQSLLSAVQARKYNAVLCMEIDRLGRGNQIDQGMIQEAFKDSKTLIITPRKVYDLQDEMDEEWSEFESFMARRELKIITRRMQRGRKQSAAEGKSISKKPPFGYQRGDDLKLYPDPDAAPIVRLIFHLSADGMGMTAVANYLTDHGIKTPAGNDEWERSSVYSILKNPVYLGHIVWGRLSYRKAKDAKGYVRSRQSREDWIVHENSHEPLIDQDTYERYQDRIRRTPKVADTHVLSNPLASLLFCAKCGKTMRRQKTYGRPHNTLLCKTRSCDTKGARFEVVEERVLSELRTHADSLVSAHRGRRKRKTDGSMVELAQQHVKACESEIAEIQTQRNRLHDLLERGIYDEETYLERSRVLGTRADEASASVERALQELEQATKQMERQHQTLPTILHVLNAYPRVETAAEKNELLRLIVDRIEYRRDADWNDPDHFEIDIFLRF